MAENEIAKHTKAIYTTLKNKEANWVHKLKEILIEVLIIVFAVSISIWFHNWSDRRQERKEEREFLTGLKKDINGDLENINSSLRFYQFALNGTGYFIKAGSGGPVNKDSLNKYIGVFFSTTDLQPHTSRYEGLKGSDKFTIIENKDLLNDIIALHESTLARINLLNNYYHDDIGSKMIPFISARIQFNPDGTIKNEKELESSSEMHFLLNYFRSYIKANVLQANELGIAKCKELINKIDKELDK
jgi:hypothetical protein